VPLSLLCDKLISFGGARDMLAPPNELSRLKTPQKNCTQFVLIVLQSFRISAPFPNSLSLKQIWRGWRHGTCIIFSTKYTCMMETTLRTWEMFLNIEIFSDLYFSLDLKNIFELIYFPQLQVGTYWYDHLPIRFYPLFKEKVGIVLLSGSEVGLESQLSRRFEVPWIRKSHFLSFIYMYGFCD